MKLIMTNLAHLRSIPGLLPSVPAPREALPFSGLKGGVPRGAVIEVCGPHGSGKTEFVLKFLSENPKLRVAWIEEQLSVYPCALPQHGVELNRVLFVDGGRELLWCAHQALRSRLFKVVVVSGFGEARVQGTRDAQRGVELRRLQLAAEQSGSTLILLSEEPTRRGAWPISVQVQVQRPKLQIIKNRGMA